MEYLVVKLKSDVNDFKFRASDDIDYDLNEPQSSNGSDSVAIDMTKVRFESARHFFVHSPVHSPTCTLATRKLTGEHARTVEYRSTPYTFWLTATFVQLKSVLL